MSDWFSVSHKFPMNGMSIILLLKEKDASPTIEVKVWVNGEKVGIWNHDLPDYKEYEIIGWKEDLDERLD